MDEKCWLDVMFSSQTRILHSKFEWELNRDFSVVVFNDSSFIYNLYKNIIMYTRLVRVMIVRVRLVRVR